MSVFAQLECLRKLLPGVLLYRQGWVTVTRDRDNRVRTAVGAGLSKYRVHQITGIGRSTIGRILSAPAAPDGANIVPSGGPDGV